jgi:hypothetical protein
MLQTVSAEELKRLLRLRICRKCQWRPSGSAADGPDTPRTCEARCPVFAQLELLLAIAKYLDPMVGSTEGAVNRVIARLPETEARLGKLRTARMEQDNPFNRYHAEIIKLMREQVLRNKKCAGR